MSKLVLSPHSDDAVFSMGSYISECNNVTILSPLMGIPDDDIGRAKHTLLGQEHKRACDVIGANHIDGTFLDDVYPGIDKVKLEEWMIENIEKISPTAVYIPVGIHHPDHEMISDILVDYAIDNKDKFIFYLYEELPYTDIYSHKRSLRLDSLRTKLDLSRISDIESNGIKESAVKKYQSQINYPNTKIMNEDLVNMIMGNEYIWEIT